MTYDIQTTADIEYARIGNQSLSLDLYRPQIDGPVPCVAYFHGGGWARGTRKEMAEERLLPVVAQGIAIASVSYRLVDVATHPAQVEDARAAVRWLRANGSRLGVRTERIGAWGASAGGWIALMLGCTGGGAEASVQAVAALFPTTNLLTVRKQAEAAGLPRPAFLAPLAGQPLPDLAAGLLGLEAITDDLSAAREASPLTHAANMTGPTLISHGDLDGLVNLQQSVDMHEALLAAGHESQLIILAGANHEDEQFESGAILAAHAGFFSAVL